MKQILIFLKTTLLVAFVTAGKKKNKISGVCPYVGPCALDVYYNECHKCTKREVCCQTGCGYMCKSPVPELPKCKPGSQAYCINNPCAVSRCAVKGAVCRANTCGGCRADWFKNGKLLSSKKCIGRKNKIPRCPKVDVYCPRGEETQCDKRKRCASDEYCCNNGCGNICIKKSFGIPPRECPSHLTYKPYCDQECDPWSGCGRDEICCPTLNCGGFQCLKQNMVYTYK